MNIQEIASAANKSYTSSGGTGQVSVPCTQIGIDINVTAITGSVTFTYQRLGFDGVWYTVWQSSSISSTGETSIDVGPGMAVTKEPGIEAQLTWTVVTGPVSFSYSIAGK